VTPRLYTSDFDYSRGEIQLGEFIYTSILNIRRGEDGCNNGQQEIAR